MRIQVNLLPGWVKVGTENPKDSPSYIRSLSTQSGTLRASWAEHKGGNVSDPTAEIFRHVSTEFGGNKQPGQLILAYHGSCDFGDFCSFVFRSRGYARYQLWTIFDGQNFIRATHISVKEPAEQEREEAEVIAKTMTLLQAEPATATPGWKFWEKQHTPALGLHRV